MTLKKHPPCLHMGPARSIYLSTKHLQWEAIQCAVYMDSDQIKNVLSYKLHYLFQSSGNLDQIWILIRSRLIQLLTIM